MKNFSQIWTRYLTTPDGDLQKKILGAAIAANIPSEPQHILDVGSGTGWLAAELADQGHVVQGFEKDLNLLNQSKFSYPNIIFHHGDIESELELNLDFDILVANTLLQDVKNLDAAFKNFQLISRASSALIVTIPNPAYAFPKAVWKRRLVDRLLRRPPSLIMQNSKTVRTPHPDKPQSLNFHELEEYEQAALKAGWTKTEESYPGYQQKYAPAAWGLGDQLQIAPLFLLLKFSKLS